MEAASSGLKGHFVTVLACIFITSIASALPGFVGVNLKYPISQTRLPKAEHLVDLLNILQIQSVKIQGEPHPSLLRALAGSGIQVVLTIPRVQDVRSISESEECATRWLVSNVIQHRPATSISGIIVGDESLVRDAAQVLVRAMNNLYASLERFNLENDVKISAAVSMDVLHTSHNKWPSAASFKAELQNAAAEVLHFLGSTRSYLTLELSPFRMYHRHHNQEQRDITLNRALPSPTNHDAIFDGVAQLTYTNLLDSCLDSTYVSMEKLGFSNVPVVIGSMPWSLSESPVEVIPENAPFFLENLVKHSQNGTPKRPTSSIRAYVSELFDIADLSTVNFGLESSRRMLADGTNGSATPPPVSGSVQFCVAKQGVSDNDLSVGLNWACGQGNVDCTPIMQNGPCFSPDTYSWHASYAFNAYYQKNVVAGGTCNFNGAAELTNVDPSSGSCVFTASTGNGSGSGGSSTGGVGGNGSSIGGSTNGVITPTNPNSPSGSSARSYDLKVCALQALVVVVLGLWFRRL